jgi:succinyl-diaminopimelate desuccinylase
MTHAPLDPADLTARLIRCASVTPEEGGALMLLERLLSDHGFACTRCDRNGIANLFARWGPKGHARSFGFNGHTDVVPVGDRAAWSCDPFGAEIRKGRMMGRGACDMKSGVAAFVTAAIDHVRTAPPDGAVIVTVTGDEEGAGVDGTAAILDWMAHEGEAMTACLVGEPTSRTDLGDMIKIGRRGSLTACLTATGVQGHAAYPDRARNPVPALVRLLDRLATAGLDDGTGHFDPSTLALTTVDVGNPATNVIPAEARATLNIRFNDTHTSSGLIDWLNREAAAVGHDTGIDIAITTRVSGESFITPPGPLSDMVAAAVTAETGRTPALSTSGGTSDARFMRAHCPVVEFGLTGDTMHKVDESVEIAQIHALKSVYGGVLTAFFARP